LYTRQFFTFRPREGLMGTSRKLRAVEDDEKASPKSVSQAAEGTQRDLLVAMRARIAKALDDPSCPPAALAALTLRLHGIARDIEAIDAADEGDDIGEAANTPDEEFAAR
jgi:hypothetical protein